MNWVESLPRVLRLRHDLPNKETGFSAYQMLFGRERPLAGLPTPISQIHSDAEDFISGMELMYLFVLHNLKMELQKEDEKFNKKYTLDDFMVGEWILLKRPTGFLDPKIQTSWPGPCQLLKKVGEHSFVI